MAHTVHVFSTVFKFSTGSFSLGNGDQMGYPAFQWLHTHSEFEKAVKGSSVTTVATKNGIFAALKTFYHQESNDDK